jgi:hypothetical protein
MSGYMIVVSSSIRWHTSGHFAKIFMIIFARINICLYNMRFLMRLNDQKGLTLTSFNTPTHWWWRFKRRYHAILNFLFTIKSLGHIECSWLNCIEKRMVEIALCVEKTEWFADFVVAFMATQSKCNWYALILWYFEALGFLSFNVNVFRRQT